MSYSHIGQAIKEKVAERGLKIADFARLIHCSRSNVYYIFKCKSMNCELLRLISDFGLVAQEESKKSSLLPQSGDFALVIDAAPFLEYAADLLNFSGGNSANAPAFQSFRSKILWVNIFLIRNRRFGYGWKLT
ncbi:hypothetical protein FACS189413_00100 [Bacteroidia bacterium]|nr:hypothetical protein FACS189413_00100 [Bacteroidia bacterium]